MSDNRSSYNVGKINEYYCHCQYCGYFWKTTMWNSLKAPIMICRVCSDKNIKITEIVDYYSKEVPTKDAWVKKK